MSTPDQHFLSVIFIHTPFTGSHHYESSEVMKLSKSRDKLTSKPGLDAGLDSFSLSRHFHVLQVP